MSARASKKLSQIAARLATKHPGLPVRDAVRVLVQNYRGEGTWYSPSQLADMLPEIPKASLLKILELLSGDPYRVLSVRWTILGGGPKLDPTEDDDQELFEVSPLAAFAAMGDGFIEHPLTGEMIPAEGRVNLHYEPNFPLATTQ